MVSTNMPSDWTDWDVKEPQTVVDSEPNPIRDTHDQPGTSILHYSPSSVDFLSEKSNHWVFLLSPLSRSNINTETDAPTAHHIGLI